MSLPTDTRLRTRAAPPALSQATSLSPLPHAIRHLQLGRPAVQLVHEAGVAAKALVALPRPLVRLPRRPLLLLDGGEPARTVPVEIGRRLLHGRELARTLFLLGSLAAVVVGAGGAGLSVALFWTGAVAVTVAVSPVSVVVVVSAGAVRGAVPVAVCVSVGPS